LVGKWLAWKGEKKHAGKEILAWLGLMLVKLVRPGKATLIQSYFGRLLGH
jgi:hypothetical protein